MNRPDYGLDAPGVVLGLPLMGAVTLAGALLLRLHPLVIGAGTLALLVGLAVYFSSRFGKLRLRDHLLEQLALRGDEQVLDVGCGRGLLLVGVAKRLTTGKASGLDLWVQTDQLYNGRDAALGNALAESVSGRVEIVDGDMRQMPFADSSFDLVVSNLAIHNVPSQAGRQRSVTEIARVLKPGGRVALVDLAFTGQYAEWLRRAGLIEVRRTWPAPWFFPPLGIVRAKKPE
jgi:SAM-dependent methyltransferase